MTIDEVLDELSDAASEAGVEYRVTEDSFEIWPYEIHLTEDEGSIRWWVGEVVGGRYIGSQEGWYSSGGASSLVEMFKP